jgi:hypothetical protein
MYARVSAYTGDGDRLLEGFADVSEPLTAIDGFSHAHFMVDAASYLFQVPPFEGRPNGLGPPMSHPSGGKRVGVPQPRAFSSALCISLAKGRLRSRPFVCYRPGSQDASTT